ncbi:MAG: hypothetical protein K2O18_06610 [Oscillospiraceae bacterium]|nr:hypothetical protein [Oscillospiraceae bacterium]
MTDKDIHDAFQRIQPDGAAQKRMLQNILRSAKQPRPVGHSVRQYLLLAATLAIVVSITAYMGVPYFAGLWRARNQETQDGGVPEPVESGAVSLQGIIESPKYRASAEWWEFWEEYTEDRNFTGEESQGIPNDYDAYGCFDSVMRQKADEICARYDLALLGPEVGHDDPENLFASAEIGNLFGYASEKGENEYGWGYRYSCGTFFFEGTVKWTDGSITEYQLIRDRKGYFYTGIAPDMLENCGEWWDYTTENGVRLLLGLSASNGLILADTDTSFVTVNILGDLSIAFGVEREELEALAEMFDFSAVP